MRALLLVLFATLGTQSFASDAEAFVNSMKKCWVLPAGEPQSQVTVEVNVRFDERGKIKAGYVYLVGHNAKSSEDAKRAFQAARRALLRCQKGGYSGVEAFGVNRDVILMFDPGTNRKP